MGETPPPAAEETIATSLPRDPPLPPGYVDPLHGSGSLDDLVATDVPEDPSEDPAPSAGSRGQQAPTA
jgi:hypothetical protein